MQTTITRQQLIDAAEDTLRIVVLGGQHVPDELAEGCREVARTATHIKGHWGEDGCGCLIGTLRMRRGKVAFPPVGSAEFLVGIAFLDGLIDQIPSSDWFLHTVLEVVD